MIAPVWICADRLRVLLQDIVTIPHEQDCKISGLQLDSRQLKVGDVFVAIPGLQFDGVDFIAQALEANVAAVLHETPVDNADVLAEAQERQIPIIQIKDLQQQVGLIASRYYGYPSRNMSVVGVTGTDGKTSVSHFIAQAIRALGKPSAVIGTIGNGVLGQEEVATHTTPNAIELQSLFDRLRGQSTVNVSMEVSSHGLHQGRVNGVEFDVAVLTNLARDHMDYHKSMEAYADAKRQLFYTQGLRAAVLNCDDDFGCLLALELEDSLPVYGYGFGDDMHPSMVMRVKGSDLKLKPNGLRFKVTCGGQSFDVRSSLLGRFNASNLLAVITTLLVLGLPLSEAIELVSQLEAVPGRMQMVLGHCSVVVDYAHTPQALEAVLKSLREHLKDGQGRLVCVFGCGGDRDKGKRALMGAAAEQNADKLIVTSDNPRSEQPENIVGDILQGLDRADDVLVELDRAKAIRQALCMAGDNDVVLIAGKGHEDYQLIGEQRLHFSDVEQVQLAWKEQA